MKILCAQKSLRLKQFSHIVDSINLFKNPCKNNLAYFSYDEIPDGAFEMVFHDSNELWQQDKSSPYWKPLSQSFVRGLHQSHFKLRIKPGTKLLIVRFKPGAFKYVIDRDLSFFSNTEVSLKSLWSELGEKLVKRIKINDSDKDIIANISCYLDEIINLKKYSVIDESVNEIIQSEGVVGIDKLNTKAKLSASQFRKKFKSEVGIAPKSFAKLIRVNSILKKLNEKRPYSLADVGYEFGYFDQSHFIKEFKSVVGCTPKQFCSMN